MPVFYTQDHIDIKAPRDVVWNNIALFDRVKLWSEWIKLENNAEIRIEGVDGEVGSSQVWNGEIIGSGKRTNTKIIPEEYIERNLILHRPIPFSGRVFYSVQILGENHFRVIHGMKASIPWHKYFAKNSLKKRLQRDLHRGLRMLKELCETEKVPSEIEHIGKREYEASYLLYVENTVGRETIAQKMREDFSLLQAYCHQEEIAIRKFLAYYPIVKEKQNKYHYWAAVSIPSFQYEKLSGELPLRIHKQEFTNTSILSVRHRGSYDFLENAWRAAYARMQNMNLTRFKKIPPFEEFIVMEGKNQTVPVADINIPLK